MSIIKGFRPSRTPPNPVFDRYDDATKAKSGYREAGGTLLVNKNNTITPLSFVSWLRAGLPGPRSDVQAAQAPKTIDGVNRYNVINLVIDRSNFYGFLRLSAMPADLDAARVACQGEQARLNAIAKSDPDLPAKQKALDRAWKVAQTNLRQASAGGGLVPISSARQYWQKLLTSFRGYVQELSDIHYTTIGSNVNATNADLEQAYQARKAEILKELANGLKTKESGAQRRYRQSMDELSRSWRWIKRRHRI